MRENRRIYPRARTLLGVVCAAALLGAGGCGEDRSGATNSAGGGTANAAYLAAVTRATYATDSVPGYKFSIAIDLRIAGRSTTVEGSGAINDGGSEGTASLQLEGKTIDEVIAKPFLYVRVPDAGDSSVTHGKPWVRADLSTFSESFGSSSFGGGSSNPTEVLGYLKAAGTVTRAGEEQVRGVASTRYHALIDLARLPAGAPSGRRATLRAAGKLIERITGAKTLPMDVWIGAGRITRVGLALSLCSPQGRLGETLSMDLYDYGRQAVVSPPPASQVTDIAAKVKSEVAKGLAQLGCH